jgi:TPR repeat protein
MMARGLLIVATVVALAAPAAAANTDQQGGPIDPSRFGEITPPKPPADDMRPAAPGGVDPTRFGDPSTPGMRSAKPVTILKSKEITPEAPLAAPAEDGIDSKRFGGRVADPAYGAFQRGLYKTAYNLALPRAEQGDAAAQTLVAELLTRGLGIPADQEAAAKWYAKAAENGVPAAQFQYALMQADGKFVKKDSAGALKLMKVAADAGNTLAQFNLAQMYVQEDRGPTGLSKALPYYEKAAKTGLPDAQYAMAQIFASGVAGRKQDLAEARRYLLLAAKQGFDTAQLDLGT